MNPIPLEDFADARAIVHDVAEIIRPPRRISVSQAAADVVRINTPGGYSGPWSRDLTPYMIEPMNALKSRQHRAVVLAAPARCGKTQGLLDGWLAHCITADPGDIGLYFSTQNLAFDFRKRRIARLHRHSPEVRKKLSKRSHDTTIETIIYRSGMILNLGWPSSSQLAQRDLRYVALTDYDSFPDDIDGEGSGFDLAQKRVQVAMSAGMALAESSPKRPIVKANWRPSTPHEAPPVRGGILQLYNRGDMRRWYWECIDGCHERFEAPSIPAFDDLPDIVAAAQSAHVACPHCGQIYRQNRKSALNLSGQWMPDPEIGQSDIASFWLLGTAAAFQKWESIIINYLSALRLYDQTGDETALIATTNTDQGMPYRPKALDAVRGADYLDNRREDIVERYYVPNEVRGLLATVDVQANRFEVMVIGHGIHNEKWLIDRFKLDRDKESNHLRPAMYIEHWDILLERAVNSTYKIDAECRMRVHAVAVDSGGGEGVTELAYQWWRSLRAKGLAHRVHLVKGEGGKSTPMVRRSFPDSSKRRDRPSGGHGDVPVLLLNSDKLKDAVYTDLQREIPGPGYIHFPRWTPVQVFRELTAEQRINGKWESEGGRRNESWDLLCYNRALWRHLGGDGVNWDRPPAWLRLPDQNPEVLSNKQNSTLREMTKSKRKIEIGVPRRQQRR